MYQFYRKSHFKLIDCNSVAFSYHQRDHCDQDTGQAHSERKAHVHFSDFVRIDAHTLGGHGRIDSVWCGCGYPHAADDHHDADGKHILRVHYRNEHFRQYGECCYGMDAEHGEPIDDQHDEQENQYKE